MQRGGNRPSFSLVESAGLDQMLPMPIFAGTAALNCRFHFPKTQARHLSHFARMAAARGFWNGLRLRSRNRRLVWRIYSQALGYGLLKGSSVRPLNSDEFIG